MQQISIWFNRNFSHIRPAIDLIHQADSSNRFRTICSHDLPGFTGFSAATQSVLEPTGLNDVSYVDYCLDFCGRNNVRLFYPGRAASSIARRKDAFSAIGVNVILAADARTFEALENKADFYTAQAYSDVPGPEFTEVTTYDQYNTAYASLRCRHPVICIKPCVGVYGIGYRVVDEQRRALEHMLRGIGHHVSKADLERELATAGSFAPLLVMEHLSGREFSVDCLASAGRLRVAIARRKARGANQIIVEHSLIERTCARLANEYNLNAIFNVQFREDRNGNLRVLEVNARMSGGSAMACLAGPNLPYLAVLDALGELEDSDIPLVAHGLHVGELRQAAIMPMADAP